MWIGDYVYRVDVIAVHPYVGHVEHAEHVALAVAHRDDYRCVIAMRTSDSRGYQVLNVTDFGELRWVGQENRRRWYSDPSASAESRSRVRAASGPRREVRRGPAAKLSKSDC